MSHELICYEPQKTEKMKNKEVTNKEIAEAVSAFANRVRGLKKQVIH